MTNSAPQRGGAQAQPSRLATMPAQRWRQVRQATTTTPGKLTVLLLVLVLLSLLFGLIGALMVQQKQDTLNDLAARREPVAIASQEIYRSLSDADATAASTFLYVEGDSARLRQRYQQDIARVGSALAVAATNSNLSAVQGNPINVLTTKLPVYTGLIEQANANNRQGFPVGAAYLREATGLMRAEMLPAAEHLRKADSQRLADQQDDAMSFPWLTTLLVILLVVALIYAQRYLRRRTNRVLNVGLVVASGAVGIAVLWGTTALVFSGVNGGDGRTDGSEPVLAFADARIAAVKARADETLLLVARSDGDQYEKEFDQVAQIFGGQDGSGGMMDKARDFAEGREAQPEVSAAFGNAKQWLAAHDKTRELNDTGRYADAVQRTVGDAPDSGGAAYYRLDRNLNKAIYVSREEFVHGTTAGANSLFGLSAGVVVLALIAIGGVTVGIWQRLREYR
jgi:hypothetical protein